MNIPQLIQPLALTLAAVERLFETSGQPGVIIGGVAVSLSSVPRTTVDVDACIQLNGSTESEILAAAISVGLKPRIENAAAFARKSNVLLLQHETTHQNVDLSLAILPFEEDAIRKRRKVNLGGLVVHLPPIEHLMVMKAVAGRARDLEDIRQLARANPTLDLNQVLRWITQFADLLGAPHLLEQARSILRPAKKRKRRPRK